MVHMNSESPNVPQSADDAGGLGNAIRWRRRHLNLTQEDLADLSGVGLRLIHEVEHDKATVKLANLLAILDVLGLHLELRTGAATTVLVGSDSPSRIRQ